MKNVIADPFRALTLLAVVGWAVVFVNETYEDLSAFGQVLIPALLFVLGPAWLLSGAVWLLNGCQAESEVRAADFALWFGTAMTGALAYFLGFVYYVAPGC